MVRLLIIFTVFCFFLRNSNGLRFASYYLDQMVLQREPAHATVWGFDELLPETKSLVQCIAKNGALVSLFNPIPHQTGENVWELKLPPIPGGTICDVSVYDDVETIVLKEVIFGDVWLCSGQSNMHFQMKDIINGTEEIEASTGYTNIRFMTVSGVSPPPLVPNDSDDLRPMPRDMEAWYNPSNHEALGEYSAVCFLYARNLYDNLKIPLGLVKAEVGGTEIEPWSPPKALETCDITNQSPHCDPNSTSNAPNIWHCNSVLYNSKINPLKRMALKGFLWYQGESNTNYNTEYYDCTFRALINSYRKEFSTNSDTSETAPFGFVQLAANRPDTESLKTPQIRWHQTANIGKVPSDVLENVFMAVAIDTYDADSPTGTVHPRYKKVVAERLSFSGLNIAYGKDEFPTNGPFIKSVSLKAELQNEGLVTITYDQDITYDDTEISGFYYCCTEYDLCENENWMEVAHISDLGYNYVG